MTAAATPLASPKSKKESDDTSPVVKVKSEMGGGDATPTPQKATTAVKDESDDGEAYSPSQDAASPPDLKVEEESEEEYTPKKKKSKKDESSDDEYSPKKSKKKGKVSNGAAAAATPASAASSSKKKSKKVEEATPSSSKKKKSKKEEAAEAASKKKGKKEESNGTSKKRKNVKEEVVNGSPPKKKPKKEDDVDVWKWWEEEKKDGGIKWNTLIHRGPLFAPPYVPLPKSVKFKYDGEVMHLSPEAEEVASFYARMLDHDYTTKDVFNTNFFKDWKKVMTPAEREKIKNLDKCDFRQIQAHFLAETEKRKAMTKEEKLKLKEEREKEQKEHGIAIIDGYRQKIANFRIEPPGLFRGRGEHPKMGCLKKRIQPEDVIINCAK